MGLSSKTNFLVVDDAESVRKMLKQHLRDIGFKGTIVEAADVDTAIELLDESSDTDSQLDFIISDWHMPDKTGIELIKYVRKNQVYANLPVIILTMESEKEVIVKAIEEGASNYLLKPWNMQDLEDKIVRAWNKHTV